MEQPIHAMFEQAWPEGDYRFFQLGFLVDDLLDAAARWARVHRIGPFHVFPPADTLWWTGGEATPLTLRVAVAQAGPVQIELIHQDGATPTIFGGAGVAALSGLHQLCTVTTDYAAKKGHFERNGYDVVGELGAGDRRIAFVDTVADFGFYTEIVPASDSFLANLARISATCANWDGRDPVRLITRDGYETP